MESDNSELEILPISSPLLEAPIKRRTHSSSSLTDPENRMSFASSSFFSAGGGSNDGDEYDNDRDEESPASEDAHETIESKQEEEDSREEGEGNKTIIRDNNDSIVDSVASLVTPTPIVQPILSSPKSITRPSPITIPVVLEPQSTNQEEEAEEERTPMASTSTSKPILAPESTTTSTSIYGICLISFDHQKGPVTEWTYPESLNEDKELVSRLPFLALPDGAHTREEDYSYFHLVLPLLAESTVFGISCNRQIPSAQLLNKGKEVTRSTVQKAIVVLASKPIFGPLRDKLGVITRAYFAQKDFEDKSILMDLHSSLEIPLAQMDEVTGGEEEHSLYMGTSLRELVHTFRFKTLMLLKLILLQKRVMFYAASSPVESLCTFQYSLVALIPALLANLQDAASPDLDAKSQAVEPPTSLRTSDKQSLLKYLGLPLHIFGKGAFFQPYLPLQQIDYLQKTDSFLVGTTNSIFQQQRDCPIDVIVNLEAASLEIADGRLAALLTLTAADRKWMDEMVSTVDSTWNAVDPSRPVGLSFIGSDDYIRAKFEEYICAMLACIKFTDFLANAEKGNTIITGTESDANMLTSFNQKFVNAFKETPAFKLWDQSTDAVIFDLVEPKHPMEGKTNVIEDVGIRLAHGLNELHIEENLAPTREAITRGITTGSDTLWNAYSSIKSDIVKRQTDRTEKQKLAQSTSGIVSPPIAVAVVDYAAPILAGVDVAKTQAASLATGLGSFFSSKRTQYFSTSTPTSPTSTSSPSLPSKPSRTPSSNSFEHSLPSLYPEDDQPSRDTPPSPTSPPASLPSFGSFFKPPSINSVSSGASSPIRTTTNSGIGLGTPSYWPNGSTSPTTTATMTPSGNFFSSFTRRVSETLAVVENNVRQYATDGVTLPGMSNGNGTGTNIVDEEEDELYQEEAVELAKVRDLDKEYEDRQKRQAEILANVGKDLDEQVNVEEEEVEDFEDINLERSGELDELPVKQFKEAERD